MDFLTNDLSIHGQFSSANQFANAVDVLMAIRQTIRRAGRELFCHRTMKDAQVTTDLTMPQAIQSMLPEKRRAWIQWLTRFGPYWTDERQHNEDEWLEMVDGDIVTDTAVGEAAFCRLNGLQREIVSFNPSKFLRTPITVVWRNNGNLSETVDVINHWSEDTIAMTLKCVPMPVNSWKSVEDLANRTCDLLTISENAFAPLEGQPYVHGAAERILIRLNVLNRMRGCFDRKGNRTPEGNRLYADHFTGNKAWFSDSSETEKREFESDLTFPHPGEPGKFLFCGWHAKIKTPQLRIHFSWPIAADIPLYVVYVGAKITKR